MPPAFLAQLSVFGGLIVFHWQVRFFVLCPLLPSTLGTTPSCFLLADVDTGVCRCVDPVVTGVDTCVYRYMDPYGHRCGRTCVQVYGSCGYRCGCTCVQVYRSCGHRCGRMCVQVYRFCGHRCGRTCVQGVDPVVTGVDARVCRVWILWSQV